MAGLGAFEIGRVLGAGGSGTVYAARCAAMGGTEVALKVLREDVAVTDRERARFMEEAGRMRRVSHPALVSVLDAGFLPDGRPYVAMPLLPGESLSARLRRGPVPLAEACALFDDLAGAVTTLHAAGLVHRDIKPENVLIGPRDGRSSAATLLDLGIARDVAAPDGTTTKVGNVRGTPAYMAMERFFGTSASVLTDVYELSVTLFMMLTGTLPWRKTEDATERMTPAHPAQMGAAIPEALAQVILRGLAAKPEARFASVAELANAVAATAGAGVEHASAPTVLAPRAVGFAPPPTPSDPQSFESTTLAPQYPRAVTIGSHANSGGGALLIAGGLFAGLVLLGALVGGAIYLRAGSAPPPAVSAVAAVPMTPTPLPSTSTAPVAADPASPTPRPSTTTPRPSVKPSASPSAAPSSTPVVDADDLRFCEALQGLYCSGDYERLKGGGGRCSSFMQQMIGNRKLTPTARAAKNTECLQLFNATNMELQLARKKAQ